MRLKILVALVGLFVSSCGDKDASASSVSQVQCKLQTSPIEWFVDKVCPADKNGNQMLMAGQFLENAGPRTGCVSISRYCIIEAR